LDISLSSSLESYQICRADGELNDNNENEERIPKRRKEESGEDDREGESKALTKDTYEKSHIKAVAMDEIAC
jgi:hypothetical protein